jgi:pimeloyl-ACP methyl ester carboxylesterase
MTSQALLDHALISQRYFFPRKDPVPDPYWIECCGARLACAYHELSPEAKTLVHFHGNGEVVADYLDGFPQLIGKMGCNCLLAEFRGYGNSTGQPLLGQMLEDVAAVINALGLPPGKIVLFGRSVGSLFALKAVELFPDVAGLILESAIADPLERLLLRIHPREIGTTHAGLAHAVEVVLDVRSILKAFRGPALILHTRHDGLIDASHAERLARWCGGPTHLHIFNHGNHNDIMFTNGPQYFSFLEEFLAGL